jgi:hypothetical protein
LHSHDLRKAERIKKLKEIKWEKNTASFITMAQ